MLAWIKTGSANFRRLELSALAAQAGALQRGRGQRKWLANLTRKRHFHVPRGRKRSRKADLLFIFCPLPSARRGLTRNGSFAM